MATATPISLAFSGTEDSSRRLAWIGQRLAEVVEEVEVLRRELTELATAPTDSHRPQITPRLLTVAQAADALGVGQSTVYGLIRVGELGSRKIGGSRRITVEDLDAFVAQLPPQRVGA